MIKSSKRLVLSNTSALVLSVFMGSALVAPYAAAAEKSDAKSKETAAETKKTESSSSTASADKSEQNDSSAAAGKGLKIGFVNTEKILRDSKPAKEAQKSIEDEFKKRDEDIQKMAADLRKKYEDFDKNSAVLNDADRNKKQREISDMETQLQRKRREFQEDLNRRRNEAFSAMVDRANTAIHNIAAKEEYDLILQDAITVSDRIDITDKVIKALDSK